MTLARKVMRKKGESRYEQNTYRNWTLHTIRTEISTKHLKRVSNRLGFIREGVIIILQNIRMYFGST
jgi:hypothetical protein